MRRGLSAAFIGFALAGCSSEPPGSADPGQIDPIVRASFRARGQAGLDRLEQTELQRACSAEAGLGPDADTRQRLQRSALATVQFPDDGRWLGQWQQGERIAQSGVGLQYSDPQQSPAGGNCYACHQLSAEEIAYGTLGPSLYRYGERARREPDFLRRTWIQIWNPHAFNVCSSMPRFGDARILTAEQIRDLMALLLDPQSPVNR